MNARIGDVYFDTCTLSTFAAVDRLDLLEKRYGYRARWTETVRWEISRGLGTAPYLRRILDLDWLGEPVEISGTPAALTAINNIRRGLGAMPGNETQHLGEAEIIYHLETSAVGAFLVTDDGAALDFARRRGVRAFDTRTIVEECYVYSEVGCPEAFHLLRQMAAEDRKVRVPSTHLEVCPT
ncbi:hypothetical protein Ade02nite_48990 [Paractinoplanes deccanensis]|uniref:PIN domain-containing protein n=1 Tax=Paractinoplanes deccanensis TaxID=113561 RepID=A0ABQ3Y8D7_9ACTN|nr:hypothetical protein [Actinoplanes deccanensis]GID76258.1 hypothetical protein Ade02nite_48990 [Actinoplanes deccanensis]